MAYGCVPFSFAFGRKWRLRDRNYFIKRTFLKNGGFMMGLLGNILGDIITGDVPGRLEENPMAKYQRETTKKVIEKVVDHFSDNSPKKEKDSATYGDVIGVRRVGYKHFAVYIGGNSVIHYAHQGDRICVHEASMTEFLDGANIYFICDFPDCYGKPTEVDTSSFSGDSIIGNPNIGNPYGNLWRFLKKHHDYHLYTPEETVQRAYEKIGEEEYNLVTNNCEHFALWCKTGIAESHQVGDLLSTLDMKKVYL